MLASLIPLAVSFIFFTSVKGDDLVRMDMMFDRDHSGNIWLQPLVQMQATGQHLRALVDTGSPIFFMWKKWYEAVLEEDCRSTVYGCYECDPPPCKAGPTKTFEFADYSEATTFLHTLTVDFGSKTANGINVGLVSGFKPETTPQGKLTNPWASLGLRKTSSKAPEYKSLIDQLLAQPAPQRLIGSDSVYTKPGEHPTGEVILGGQDPTKYDGLLEYVKIIDDEEQFIQLVGVRIGEKDKDRIKVKAVTVLDSGTTGFVFPINLKKDILKLLGTAGKKKVNIEEQSGSYLISCDMAKYLPSITFYLTGLQGEEVPLTLPGTNMVTKGDGNDCYVNVEFDAYDEWIIGSRAFVGYYYFYELSESRIGFAVARP